MSIYIPGMKMPKDGNHLVIFSDGEVWRDWKCPKKIGTAIELQTHGRLVDADDLEERIKICQETAQNDDFNLGAIWYSVFADMAALSPTIIPADRAKEEGAS